MNDFLRDLRYASRVLLRSPVTTGVAILGLALGIGVNASSFIAISSLILHPLPYPHIERIVTLWEALPKLREQRQTPLTPADFIDVKNQTHSFAKLAGYRGLDVNLTGSGNPERLQAFAVSPDFFAVLGTNPLLGRTFTAGEDLRSRSRVAVVSEGFWKSHLAASPTATGKSISLNGQNYIIAGVMPDSFDYPLGTDLWTPLTLDPVEQHQRDSQNLMVLGLLKPQTSAGEARADIAAVASRLEHLYPKTNEGRGMLLVPLRDLTDSVTSHFVVTLLGAAGFVLLLACANIGNLQLARATNREKEIAVRSALGASRFQIARQLLAETVLISLAAGTVGLILASWNNAYMKSDISAEALRIVPGLRTMHVDSTVILFTLIASLVAGVLCSLPAISQAAYGKTRADLNDVLRSRGSSSGTPARSRLRSALIVSELALALVLLVGAGLMVKTFERLLYLKQGFDPKNLLTMQVSLPTTEYRDSVEIDSFYDRALQSFATVHNVRAAALSSYRGPSERFYIEGQPEPRPGEPRPEVTAVSAQYVEAMRIPLLKGRSISDRDGPESPRVVVISEGIARHYWPHSDPIGHHIQLNAQSGWLTIAGVSGDVIEDWFSGQPSPMAYVSYAQFPSLRAMFVLRTEGDPMQAAPAARLQMRNIDRDLAAYEVQSMERKMAEERGGVHAAAQSMTIYAVIALLLAITGIYGVISYFVAARTHDIGVRMALGASRGEVLRITMFQGLRLIATGLAFGIPLAVLLARIMSSVLYNVVRVDAATFAVFAGILVASALLASYLPSRRAMRIDPMTALRNE